MKQTEIHNFNDNYKNILALNMIHLAYIVMSYILLAEVILFLLLALPTPHGVKGRIVKFILNSKVISIGKWGFLALCLVSTVFFAELHQTESIYDQ